MSRTVENDATDSSERLSKELVQLARLAMFGREDNIPLFLQRLARRYRSSRPELAKEIIDLLRQSPLTSSPTRGADASMPVDIDTRLQLLREDRFPVLPVEPIFSKAIKEHLDVLRDERHEAHRLIAAGLPPSKSALFVGPPGVGKTLAARWLARELDLPLLTLDLSAVMSSFLGRTGTNIRRVLDYAKQASCVLLLDELDAVAKRRDDITEIGELKRLVTVLLQEIDDWPGSSVLLAASNHPDLLDPAVWRRFDAVVRFELPGHGELVPAIRQSLAEEAVPSDLIEVMARLLDGESFSEVEREMLAVRRRAAIHRLPVAEGLLELLRSKAHGLSGPDRIHLAMTLVESGQLSQRRVSELTGVSRDTIRRHSRAE